MSEHEFLAQHMVDIHKATAEFFARRQKGNLLHLLTRKVPINTLLPARLCRGDSASTTGTLDHDGERRCFRETNCRNVAYHYLARGIRLRRPRASHESLPRDPLRRLCSPLQQGTPSTPTPMSSPSTFMTQEDGICLIKSWKVNRDGSCKVFFEVPHFVDQQ